MKRRYFELVLVVVAVALAVLFWNQSRSASPVEKPIGESAGMATPDEKATPGTLATPPRDIHLANDDGPGKRPSQTGVSGPLVPLEGKNPPAITKIERVQFETDHGTVTMELYPEAAPNAVARFLQLVDQGFYEHTPVSRVVPGFVVQFGINAQMADWKEKPFNDDPSLFQLLPGTLAFAKAGLDTNSTQVFINLAENNGLADPSMNFTVFGKVVEGMNTVEAWPEVGDDPQMGLDQQRLWTEGDKYLATLAVKPAMITKVKRLP